MTEHTHTPGMLTTDNAGIIRSANNSQRICDLWGETGDRDAANARRLVACWNACERAGLSNEQLDAGILDKAAAVPELVEALQMARVSIKALHGPVAWNIFEAHSPEMLKIDAALRKAGAK